MRLSRRVSGEGSRGAPSTAEPSRQRAGRPAGSRVGWTVSDIRRTPATSAEAASAAAASLASALRGTREASVRRPASREDFAWSPAQAQEPGRRPGERHAASATASAPNGRRSYRPARAIVAGAACVRPGAPVCCLQRTSSAPPRPPSTPASAPRWRTPSPRAQRSTRRVPWSLRGVCGIQARRRHPTAAAFARGAGTGPGGPACAGATAGVSGVRNRVSGRPGSLHSCPRANHAPAARRASSAARPGRRHRRGHRGTASGRA